MPTPAYMTVTPEPADLKAGLGMADGSYYGLQVESNAWNGGVIIEETDAGGDQVARWEIRAGDRQLWLSKADVSATVKTSSTGFVARLNANDQE